MALQVWLPLNKNNLNNVGLAENIEITSTNTEFKEDVVSPLENGARLFKSNNSHLALPSNNTLIKNKPEISLAFWCYQTIATGQTIFTFMKSYFDFSLYNNKLYVRTNGNGGDINGNALQLTLPQQTINEWHHYAFTFNRGLVKCYIDGDFSKSGTTAQNDTMFSGITTYCIGGYSSTYKFSGYTCDFRIYDNAINEDDVKRICNQKLFELIPYSGVKDVLFDRSGLMNMPLANQNAVFQNNALYFNGSAKLRPKEGNVGFTMEDGTLSVWFTIETASTNYQMIYIDSVSKFSIGIIKSSNTIITTCNGTGSKAKFIGTSIKYDGSINNIIVSYNTDKTPQFMLINGVSVGTNGTYVWTESNGLTIGNRMYNSAQSGFKGKLLKVGVYNRQFTQDEAVELYNSEKGIFLPDDYIQLEYIESNTGQTCYINTGVKINKSNCNKLRIEVDGNFGTNAQWRVDGLSKTINNIHTTRYVGLNSSAKLSYGNNSDVSTSFTETDLTGRHLYVIDYKKGQLKRDNVLVTDFRAYNYTHEFEDDLFIFAWKSDATRQKSAKKYGVKIYLDDVLQFNGIPAKRKSDNIIGMYDMVSRKFFTNAGTGSFTGA